MRLSSRECFESMNALLVRFHDILVPLRYIQFRKTPEIDFAHLARQQLPRLRLLLLRPRFRRHLQLELGRDRQLFRRKAYGHGANGLLISHLPMEIDGDEQLLA